MKLSFIAWAVIIVIGVLVIGLVDRIATHAKIGKFRARSLMTENEREFFSRLLTALPEHFVFPQVAMSAILEASSTAAKQAYRDRLRIAQQRVDYLVCDQMGQVVAVVELDDRTHSAARDEIRDARLLQAGIRTIRFQSRNKPMVDAIRATILPPQRTLTAD